MNHNMTCPQFVRSRCFHLTHMIRKHAEAVSYSSDPRHLHQLRVASRRLRNTLDVFEEILPPHKVTRWKHGVKQLGQILSAARDLDVQVQFLNDMIQRHTDKEGQKFFKCLASEFTANRQRYQPRVRAALRQIKRMKTLKELNQALERQADQDPRPFQTIYTIAYTKINQRIQKLLTYEQFVDQPQAVDALHKLRIANKHLRYTLETLHATYSKEVDAFLEKILFYHRTLGKMHDFDIWLRFLNQRSTTDVYPAAGNAALKNFRAFCAERRSECYDQFRMAWHKERKNRLFEDLLGYIRSAAMFPPIERKSSS